MHATSSLARFSLIELMVVVATISIFAALLMPALNRAKRATNNVNGLATWDMTYAHDWNGILHCPEATAQLHPRGTWGHYDAIDYGINAYQGDEARG